MRIVDIIDRKRRGDENTDQEIRFLVQSYTDGAAPDYQMSAWLMAVLWRGLTEPELFALTDAMIASGDVLDLSSIPGTPVDKHSTGGVGDKTTLAVVPILASAGVPVAKMSGHGLGHTGGTLDKLESIPGVRTQLSLLEILDQVNQVGACLCAQTDRLVPADRKIYALRDATATVQSIPLIAASIMSKKIASGSSSIILDVKVGGGAFAKDMDEARELAALMTRIGDHYKRRVVAVLSDMDVPLGFAVGNRVEVREVVALLRGDPQTEPRLKHLVRYLAAIGLLLGGRVATLEEGETLADQHVASGAALAKFREIIECQGGKPGYLDHLDLHSIPNVQWDIKATTAGYIAKIDATSIGLAAMRLGAGRMAKGDIIDPTAGIMLRQTVGSQVSPGTVIATLYAGNEEVAREIAPEVAAAFTFSTDPQAEAPLVHETIGLGVRQ